MAYSPPQRFRAPNGATALLPPEVASGLVGLQPDGPPPAGADAAPVSPIPAPPPGAAPAEGLLAPPLAPSSDPLPVMPVAPPRDPAADGYKTPLTPQQEGKFRQWVAENKVPWKDDARPDYDMRGYWLAMQAGDPRAAQGPAPDGSLHFPDTWKTPYHATFSNESQYATADAPHWVGNVLVGNDGAVVADERSPDEKRADAQAGRLYGAAAEEAKLTAGGYAPVAALQRQALERERVAGAEQIAAEQRVAEAEAKAIAEGAAREQQIEAQRAAAQQATLADIERRSAAIDSEIERIATMKIDASVRRPAIAAIGLAIGAIGAALSGRTDGSNPALDIMMKQIDANVQRQMSERDAQTRAVGMRRDQIAGLRQKLTDTGALYDGLAAAETRRLRSELARVAASSKSDATRANLLKLDADLAVKEAEWKGSTLDKQFAKDDRDRQFAEQQRASRDASARGWAGLQQSAFQFSETMRQRREEQAEALAAEVAKLAAAGENEKAKLLRERGIGGAAEVVRDEQGNIVRDADGTPQVRHVFMKMRDGKTDFIPSGTPEDVGKLRKQKSAADNLIAIIDEVQALGPEWLSDTRNSDKLKQLKALWADAKLETKDYKELGVIAGPDLDLIEAFLGTGDPTGWRDSRAGIAQARKNIVRGINTKLRNAGFDGEYKPTNLAELRPAKAPEDEAGKRVLEWKPTPRAAGRVGGLVKHEGLQSAPQLQNIRAIMDQWARAAESADPAVRDKALAWLSNAAGGLDAKGRETGGARSREVREYAAELLRANADRMMAAEPVAREQLPGMPR